MMCMNNLKNNIKHTYTMCRITLLRIFEFHFVVEVCDPCLLKSYSVLHTT